MESSRPIERPTPEEAVAALFDGEVRVTRRAPVSGGCINRASRLLLSDGRSLFLKENDGRHPDMFRREAEGLQALAAAGGPPVPTPLAFGATGRQQYLLLEYVPSAPPRADCWEVLGRELAQMHRATDARFGFTADNYIGATPQPNPRAADWSEFFGRHRLGFQLSLAIDGGRADGAMVRGVRRIIERLDDLLLPPPHGPALLHGDLWSGNVMVGAAGEAVIIDPAVYYGHPEADLAMTEMFGALPPAFYDAYAEVSPLEPGYPERRELYNLYHALNHLNLFGGGYRSSVMGVVRRFA